MSKSKFTLKELTFSAMFVALATLLSYVKLFHLPTGGSITLLSMLFICLPGYFFGLRAGLFSAIAYGLLQFLQSPTILYPLQVIIDYPLAFGALGLSGLFSGRKNGLQLGYLAGITGRFIFSTLSGWLFFAEYAWEGFHPLVYSSIYNLIYIYSEGIVTLLVICLPPVRKTIEWGKSNLK